MKNRSAAAPPSEELVPQPVKNRCQPSSWVRYMFTEAGQSMTSSSALMPIDFICSAIIVAAMNMFG